MPLILCSFFQTDGGTPGRLDAVVVLGCVVAGVVTGVVAGIVVVCALVCVVVVVDVVVIVCVPVGVVIVRVVQPAPQTGFIAAGLVWNSCTIAPIKLVCASAR